MIIYDNNKEFLGIDKDSLKSLGFSNLLDLQSEAVDFGDLFVKTPGYVHNFKHVHWIDFVLCEEDKNACKAIIHTSSGNFFCILEIKTIYLTSSPNSKSYIINLNNLRALSTDEIDDISNELKIKNIQIAQAKKEQNNKETYTQNTQQKPQVQNKIVTNNQTSIDDPYENDEAISLDKELTQEQLDAIGDAEIGIVDYDLSESKNNDTPIQQNENLDFDIEKTAEILEMDVATIKDFVNDFIVQANEFKEKLYDSIVQKDLIVLKSLSHQLKGVAANLRIHDCQNILVKINKSSDFTTSKADLDTFYNLIAKLSGEETTPKEEPKEEPTIIKNDVEDIDIINEEKIDIQPAIENEDEYILEIDDELTTVTNDKNKPNDLEKKEKLSKLDDINIDDDEYILEIDDAIISISDDTTKDTDSNYENDTSTIKYNKIKIANEIGLDEQSFNELYQEYIQESQKLISIIQKAIEDDEFSKWKYSAVKLKGMSNNMRIDNFSSELETLISTKDKDSAQKALKKIESSLSNTSLIKD